MENISATELGDYLVGTANARCRVTGGGGVPKGFPWGQNVASPGIYEQAQWWLRSEKGERHWGVENYVQPSGKAHLGGCPWQRQKEDTFKKQNLTGSWSTSARGPQAQVGRWREGQSVRLLSHRILLIFFWLENKVLPLPIAQQRDLLPLFQKSPYGRYLYKDLIRWFSSICTRASPTDGDPASSSAGLTALKTNSQCIHWGLEVPR